FFQKENILIIRPLSNMNKTLTQCSDILPRICFLTESFYPTAVGGLEKISFVLADRLINRGCSVFVLTRQLDPKSPTLEYVSNVPVKRVPPHGLLKGKGWKALRPLSLFLVRIFYLLLKEAHSYDVIMMFGAKLLPIPTLLARMITRKKCVVNIQSPIE